MVSSRNLKVDLLKFFGIFFVVLLHVISNFDASSGLENYIVKSLVGTGVPIFFISSGYLLYNKFSKDYIRKYMLNLLKTFSIWYVLYFLEFPFIQLLLDDVKGNFLKDYTKALVKGIKGITLTNLYYTSNYTGYHLWYLTAMLVAIPLIYFPLKSGKITKSLLIAFPIHVVGVLVPLVINRNFRIPMRDGLFFGFFYLILGVYIKKNEAKIKLIVNKLSKKILVLILLITLSLSSFERYYLLKTIGAMGDFGFGTILLAISLFLFVLSDKVEIKENILTKIGSDTLGIYLLHVFIINILVVIRKYADLNIGDNAIVFYIGLAIFVLFLTYYLYKLPKTLLDLYKKG